MTIVRFGSDNKSFVTTAEKWIKYLIFDAEDEVNGESYVFRKENCLLINTEEI